MTAINKQIITSLIYREIANKLIGKSGTNDRSVFTSRNPYGGVGDAGFWVRNPNCWLNGVNNISCFSPAQRSGANWWQRGGTLLTRKHVAFAAHFAPSIISGGTPLIFVDENNNAISRKIISYNNPGNDIAIALLDGEVPSNIKISKVLPSNYASYITAPLRYMFIVNQDENANVFRGSGMASVSNSALGSLDRFSTFFQAIRNGDSGSPLFIIIDNDLVCLGSVFSTGGPQVHYGDRIEIINNAITALSPGEGYSLSLVDLATIYNTELNNTSTLYYNAIQDNNWSNVNNWWNDIDHTVPSNRLPTNRDSVILSANCVSNSSSSIPMVADMTVKNNTIFGITVDVINEAKFENSSTNTGIVYGNATFAHNSTNNGTVSHVAKFLDASICLPTGRLQNLFNANLSVTNRLPLYGINGSDILGLAK